MTRKATSQPEPAREVRSEERNIDELPPRDASVTQKAQWVDEYVRHYGRVYDKQS